MRPLLVVAAWLWLSSAGAAQEPARSVELTLVGDLAEASSLPERVTSWFAPSRTTVRVTRVAALDTDRVLDPPRGAVSAWVTRSGEQVRMYFAAPRGDHFVYLLRTVPLSAGLDELGQERVAAVVHLSCEALFEDDVVDERAAVERSLAPAKVEAPHVEAPVEPAPTPALPRRVTFGASVGYGATLRGDEGLGHGPRLALELSFRRAGLGLVAIAALPGRAELGAVRLELRSVSVAPYGLGRLPLGPRTELVVYAGPNLAVVHYAATPQDETLRVAGATRELRVGAWSGIALRVQLGRVALGVALEADVAFARTRYQVKRADGGRRLVGSAAQVAPGAALSVLF